MEEELIAFNEPLNNKCYGCNKPIANFINNFCDDCADCEWSCSSCKRLICGRFFTKTNVCWDCGSTKYNKPLPPIKFKPKKESPPNPNMKFLSVAISPQNIDSLLCSEISIDFSDKSEIFMISFSKLLILYKNKIFKAIARGNKAILKIDTEMLPRFKKLLQTNNLHYSVL